MKVMKCGLKPVRCILTDFSNLIRWIRWMDQKLSAFSHHVSVKPLDSPIRDTFHIVLWVIAAFLLLLSFYLYEPAEWSLNSMKVRGKLHDYKHTRSGKTLDSVLINKINKKHQRIPPIKIARKEDKFLYKVFLMIIDQFRNFHLQKFTIINYTHSMQEIEELSFALITLGKKILDQQNWEEQDRLAIAFSLLLDIDREMFQPRLKRQDHTTFKAMKQAIDSYYRKIRGEIINWNSGIIKQYPDDFIQVFIFVFDLALKLGRDNYIEDILEMPRQDQIVLQPFVENVTQRQLFLQSIYQKEVQNQSSKILDLMEENQSLRSERDLLFLQYKNIKQNFDQLTLDHERIYNEANLLKQQRIFILNQLAAHESATVEEIVGIIKNQQTAYQRCIQNLEKQLFQQNKSVRQKEEQIKIFQHNFKIFQQQTTNQQLSSLRQRITQMEYELIQMSQREDNLRNQLEQSTTNLTSKVLQVEQLTHRISNLQIIEQKYSTISKLHFQFKAKIIKGFKHPNQ